MGLLSSVCLVSCLNLPEKNSRDENAQKSKKDLRNTNISFNTPLTYLSIVRALTFSGVSTVDEAPLDGTKPPV